jgi:hypothetical protein
MPVLQPLSNSVFPVFTSLRLSNSAAMKFAVTNCASSMSGLGWFARLRDNTDDT